MSEHSPTPWTTCYHEADGEWVIHEAESYVCAQHLTSANAERIVACVNACADIPTESLTAVGWQLAPKAGARPVDVAKLLLKMEQYRNAMAKLVEQAQRCNFMDENGHLLSMNTAYQTIEELLK